MDLQYLYENSFTAQPMEENPPEEAFARDWAILLDRHTGPAHELLRDMCVELHFSVRAGQSNNPKLLTALQLGHIPPGREEMWIPVMPDGIRVYLYPTPAGRLPVIECEADADFIHLQQSLVYRCEPRPIHNSQGAAVIKNYNNWARVDMHRSSSGAIPDDPALYRDYIALLSHRFYSGVAPEIFGLSETEWKRKSFVLRREHEISHYMTQRFYHSSKKDIHDEIIADFMGLTAAFGEYDPNKLLTFLGLEQSGEYRKGGRLELYLGGEAPEGGEFSSLCDTVRSAAENITDYYAANDNDRIKTFHALCRSSVADMARGGFAI